jgi:hypothetical protein
MSLRDAIGSSVGRQDRAGRCRFAGHESKSPAHPVVTKEALAGAKDDGVDHQTELIDQIVCEKRLHERGVPIASKSFPSSRLFETAADTCRA